MLKLLECIQQFPEATQDKPDPSELSMDQEMQELAEGISLSEMQKAMQKEKKR